MLFSFIKGHPIKEEYKQITKRAKREQKRFLSLFVLSSHLPLRANLTFFWRTALDAGPYGGKAVPYNDIRL